MNKPSLYAWNIYEIHTAQTEIHDVMLRGRIRKLGLEHKVNVLCENATDEINCVRFAVLSDEDAKHIIDYLQHIIPDAIVEVVAKAIKNPVLSKLKVNKEDRYTL